MKARPAAALLAALAGACICAVVKASDFYDDFDASPPPSSNKARAFQPPSGRPGTTHKTMTFDFFYQDHYYIEIIALTYFAAFVINFVLGRTANEKIALAWAREYCSEGALLEKNFSLLGPGYTDNRQEMLMKHSHSQFQLWASGRRCAAATSWQLVVCLMSSIP